MTKRKLTVFLLPDEKGYTAHFPYHDLITQGDTVEEALEMAQDAIESHLEVLAEDKRDLFLDYSRFGHVVVAEIEAELSPAVIELEQEQEQYLKGETEGTEALVEAPETADVQPR